jgi:hypothetical protein
LNPHETFVSANFKSAAQNCVSLLISVMHRCRFWCRLVLEFGAVGCYPVRSGKLTQVIDKKLLVLLCARGCRGVLERLNMPQAQQAQTEPHQSLTSPSARTAGRVPTSATLQTTHAPQIQHLPVLLLAYFCSPQWHPFYSTLDSVKPLAENAHVG